MKPFTLKKQDKDDELYIRLRESAKQTLSPEEKRAQYISYLNSIVDNADREREREVIERIVDEVYG